MCFRNVSEPQATELPLRSEQSAAGRLAHALCGRSTTWLRIRSFAEVTGDIPQGCDSERTLYQTPLQLLGTNTTCSTK